MKYDIDHCTRLLKERKLILICDLDETLISSIYLNDNYLDPNFDKSIVVTLSEEQKKNNHIYIKLRPHLSDFLEKISNIFELHLMSMGNEAHVKKCVEIIDPYRQYFGDRITSRENIVNSDDKAKTTEEMFQEYSNIIISLDDNIDVWNNSATLISIEPLNYFSSLEKMLKCLSLTNKKHMQIYIEDYLGNLEMCLKDNSLLFLQSVLKEFHEEFFKVLDKGNSDKTKMLLPDIGHIMDKKRNRSKI